MNYLNKAFGGWQLFDLAKQYRFYKPIKISKTHIKPGFSNENTINRLQRKYRRKFNTLGFFTYFQWKLLIKFYCPDLICISCGNPGFIIPDHITSAAIGGSNDIENIQPICEGCNIKKGQRKTDYRKDNGNFAENIAHLRYSKSKY